MSTTIASSSLFADEATIHAGDFGPFELADAPLVYRRDLSADHRDHLEQLAFQYACVPESYDIAVSEGHVLQTPCRRGAVSVLVDGKFWHIAGNLLAPENLKPQMVRDLKEISQRRRRTIAVYNVSRTDAERFRDEGFVVNKFGEEPVLNLQDVDWSGKKFEWVRRQSHFCSRAGVEIAEITDRTEQHQLAETLVSIMMEDLADRTLDKPLRLLEGEFRPHSLQRRRLFVARSSDGLVEAFLACSPINGGRGWAFETYRKRRDATRGVTAFLFRAVADQLKSEGVEQVSLCLIPGRNVADSAVGRGDWRVEKILSLFFRRGEFFFNVKGQDHFKSRFRPDYVDRYLCVAPKNSAISIWSFMKTTGALNCNYRNMLKRLGPGNSQ